MLLPPSAIRSVAVEDISGKILEETCIRAFRVLRVFRGFDVSMTPWARPLPSPPLAFPRNQFGPPRLRRHLQLSPGGRFLVQLDPNFWHVIIWDLQDMHTPRMEPIYSKYIRGTDRGEPSAPYAPQCAVAVWEDRAHVILHVVETQPELMCVLSQIYYSILIVDTGASQRSNVCHVARGTQFHRRRHGRGLASQ